MAPKRDLDTARQWGREILKTHELEEFTSSSEDAIVPVIDTTEVQADAQPRKMSISGIMNTAIQAGIVAPGGGGGGSSASGIAAGSGIYITQSGGLQVINAEETLVSGVAAGSGIYITQDGSNQVINSTLPTASGDGVALVYANGDWAAGPVIGGVNYSSGGDSNFSDVGLLLPMDGVNGGTTFIDESNTGATVTPNANNPSFLPTTTSSVVKFGSTSAEFNAGDTNYLSVPNSSLLQVQDSDFTIECWVNFGSSPAANWGIFKKDSFYLGGNANRWVCKTADGTGNAFVINWTPSASTWYHVALTNSSGTVTLYIDGTSIGSGTFGTATPGTGDFEVARGTQYLTGYIDDFRVTKGVVRYTSNFTPPTAAFPTSGGSVVIPYSVGLHDDVDITTTPPTEGDSLVWASGVGDFVPGTRVKSDTTLAGAGASGVSNLVTISQTDYDALATPNADTIYFIV